MKKVYLLLAAMLGLFVSTNALADQFNLATLSRNGYTADGERPLITDAWRFSSPYSQNDLGNKDGDGFEALLDEDPNTFWHSYWGGGSVDGGTHYFQVEMPAGDYDPDEPLVFVFTRRGNADNDHTIEWKVMGTDDPDAAKADCDELAYVETPFGSKTETCMSSVFRAGEYAYLRFYSEAETGASYGTRGYFHLSEFNIFPAIKMDPKEEALAWLDATYEKYSAYEYDFDDRGGEEPGDYSQEAIDAFIAALDAYLEFQDNDDVTSEDIYALGNAIIDTYNAIAATKVPIVVESGYYRIHTGMMYGAADDMFMYGQRDAGKLWAAWGAPDQDTETGAIQVLWKITAVTDSTYQIQNMYHDGKFCSVKRSTDVEMSTESDSLVFITAQAYDHYEDHAYVNFRLVGDKAGTDPNYVYLHQNNHSNGSGTGAKLVGWSTTWQSGNTPGASEWFLEKVEDDEAEQIIKDYEPYKNKDIWMADFKVMMDKAPGMIEVAKDVSQVNLITDAAQFSSPYSHNDQEGNGTDGGNLSDGVLIDNNTSTYWHSAWQNIPDGKHYLQVELPADFDDAQEIYMKFTRRDTNNNQIDQWSFKGTNDFEAEEDDCEELATFESPWHSSNQTESYKSDLFNTSGYKYIRFYNEHNNAGSAFFHLSEIQLCYDVDNPNSQYHAMGDIATNLEALVAKYAEIADEDELEFEDYQALKAAYDAFVGFYVDPQVLRDSIAIAEAKAATVVAGTNPGFWSDTSAADALTKAVADAKAYDEAGAYTPAQTREFLDAFKTQMAAIDEAPNKIKEGKWYRIRFGTEEEFDKYGWKKEGNDAYYRVIDGDTVSEVPIHEANYGKYMTVAKWVAEQIDIDDNGNPVNAAVITPVPVEEVTLGTYIHGDDLKDIENPDMALFRFVLIGDSAYAIQNKATGLYFTRPTESGDVRLGIHPVLYTQKVIGWGQNSFFAKSVSGTTMPPLHFARNYNILTQWGGTTIGWGEYDSHRGAFYVEEVEDVAADFPVDGDFKMKAYAGSWLARTYPVSVTAKSADEGIMWTVNSIEGTEGEEDEKVQLLDAKITLSPIGDNAAVAGRPFIYIVAGDYTSQADRNENPDAYEPAVLNFSYKFDLVGQPQTDAALKGVLDGHAVDRGVLVVSEVKDAEGDVVMGFAPTGTGASVGSNSAYIADTEDRPFFRNVVLEVLFNKEAPDAINTAISNISRSGAIYTIDGRLVKAHGNANDLKNMPKGAYILNGTKVLVK